MLIQSALSSPAEFGGKIKDGCKTCEMKEHIYYECNHNEDWDPCLETACAQNKDYYQNCIPLDKKNKEDKADCDVVKALAVFAVQTIMKATKPADCGDVWQDFSKVPQPTLNACSTYAAADDVGKCFLLGDKAKVCKGMVVYGPQAMPRRAGEICKGWGGPKIP